VPIRDLGQPDEPGRIPFVWVSDDTTGHRYDIKQTALREGMTPVDGVDLNWSDDPRPTKFFTGKDGADSAPRRTEVPSGDEVAAAKAAAANAKAGAR
jgi:hypothetical protein